MKRYQTQVADWMSSPPIVVAPNTSLAAAYELMQEHDIRRLLVVSGRELIGIVALSDILGALPAPFVEERESQPQWTRLTVADVMTYDPVTVDPEDTIQEAAERMLEYKISALPVISGGLPAGIITESDIFRLVVEEWAEELEGA
jgi:acetoin utilization protein AcuB